LWIADFRDPITQPTNGFFQRKINSFFQKRICKVADIITAVSNGYLAEIVSKQEVYNKYVITNGFDDADLSRIGNIENDDLFSFAYTGTTYAGKRDLTPLFLALRELIDEKEIDINNLKIRYAGPDKHVIYDLAVKFALSDIIEAFDMLPRIEALKMQAKSKLLVVSTWNEKGHKGVLPGKLLEYLMFKKNLIAIVGGSEKNSEIREMIKGYNLGFCYESSNDEEDYSELKNFILLKYKEYLENNSALSFIGDDDLISSHNYEVITKKFVDIIAKNITTL